MTIMTPEPDEDELEFEGEPFDGLSLATATGPAPAARAVLAAPAAPAAPVASAPDEPAMRAATSPAAPSGPTEPIAPLAAARPPAAAGRVAAGDGAARIASLVREVRAVVVAAHDSALRAQDALSQLTLAGPGRVAPRPGRPTPVRAAEPLTAVTVPAATRAPVVPAASPVPARLATRLPARSEPPALTEAAFKPLARSDRRELTAADLAALSRGDVAAVFGPAYDQQGANPGVRLPAAGEGLHLTGVADLRLRGGAGFHGSLRAGLRPLAAAEIPAAVAQAAQVFALYVGLHLCLADAGFVVGAPPEGPDGGPRESEPPVPTVSAAADWAGGGELFLEVTAIDLLPRPWLTVDAQVRVGDQARVVAEVRGLTVGVRERPGAPVGPEHGGAVTAFLGRRNAAGDRALLSEFHMAHCARGDQGIGLGPEFAAYRGRRATRLPGGGLRLVDRVMAMDSGRGALRGGATHVTEYDAAADSWYFTDTANASMPNLVYMETSLQSALMLGYYLGATLTTPQEDYSLRNLGGSATVLREVELRDATIRQHSALLSTNPMPGSVLQDFSYRLAVGGTPFYEGESMFGYFNAPALARQSGLDAGRLVPTWLDAQDVRPPVRVIDVAARRARPDAPLCARGQLALLDDVEVVDGGGRYGQGYLRAARPIDPDAWFFARHFHLDPVIPGSLGVETVLQAMQEWAVDAGYLTGLARPGFVLPVGVTLRWKYRGQFLPSDRTSTLEVHIKDISRRPGRVRVIADASVWKPTMRVYELTDVAIELRDEGAPPW